MAGKSRKGKSGRQNGWAPKLDLSAQQWVVAFLIGLATVFAAAYGWRAAAIGSTAAFDDRQSISETIKSEQQRMDIGIAVSNDTRGYTRYLINYAAAAELDNQADGLEKAGQDAKAADARQEAQLLRRASTVRAADAGVFGRSTIEDDLNRPSATPRAYDFDDQVRARTAEEQTGIDSPGKLNPNYWAQEAEGIRDRIKGLAAWALIMLMAVLLFTVAEANSARRPVFYSAITVGAVVLLVGAIGGLTFDFFV
jgi:hypothetical protein